VSFPTSTSQCRFPPIALDRAAKRASIPDSIRALREELSPCRAEMRHLSQVLRGPYDQREIEGRCRDVMASFQAVVPASRQEGPSVLLPLLKLYSAVKSPLELLIRHLSPDYRPQDPQRLANRTVTGRVFSKLLSTDSMYSLISHFLTPAEIRALDVSRRAGQRQPDR
jgi:hypothetical protein